MTQKRLVGFTSAHLHMIGMALMLCDHMWAVGMVKSDFFTIIGRIAYPIFAFLMVEGFFHTRNVKKYLQRLLVFAIISEIPFNLVAGGGSLFYPLHQNVLWTFLLGLLMLHFMEKQKTKSFLTRVLMSGFLLVVFLLLALIGMVDYYAPGILTIFVFYLFHGNKWYHYLGQLCGLYYINCEVLGGLVYPVSIGDWHFEFPQQCFALLALLPIWLYNGNKGYDKKWFKFACYGFYPLHLLILGLWSIFSA